MSNEKRSYVKRKRAQDEEQTRAAIAQAAVELHGTIGPAFTTISAVAQQAGVRRATVYRHFPDETALFSACSARWLAQNPLPAMDGLQDIPDPADRLAAALDTLYAYYRPNARMLANVIRDAEGSPALKQTLAGFEAWLERLHRDLVCAHPAPDRDKALLAPAIAHAVSFAAWHALGVTQGLPDTTARRLMCALVRAAAT